MGSQPKVIEQNTVQDNAPWKPAQPHFLDLYTKASEALGQTNKNPFMGDFIAQPGANAAMGLDQLTKNATSGLVGTGAADFLNMGAATARGDFLRPETNPFISSTVNAAIRPMQENFTSTVLPNITDRAIAEGAYGGARQDVSQERAAQDLNRTIGDISSNIFMQNYMSERGNQMNAGNVLGQGYDLANAPGQQLLSLDEIGRNNAQLGIDNTHQKFMEQKTAPWYGLGEMAQLLSQGGFSTVTGNSRMTNPNYQDPFTSLLKGIIGGGSAIAGMGGSGGFGLWGRR